MSIWAAKKRLKEVSSKYYVKVRSLQFFGIIFIFLIASLLVNLIDRQPANKKQLAKIEKRNYYSDIIVQFNIAKYLKISRCILKSVKLKKRNGSEERQEKRYKKVFGCSLFLVIKPSSAV